MRKCTWSELSIEVRDEPPNLLRLDWTGKSNHMRPETVLGPFFSEISRSASSGKRVEMHFERLEFFNSSTISAIIEHVQDLRRQRVPLTMSYDPRRRWQKAFFDALAVFDRGDGMFSVVAV